MTELRVLSVTDKVRESNRIEKIYRDPTNAEVDMFNWFQALDKIEIYHLQKFVNVYQPGTRLRDLPGIDVYIGSHHPPKGGPHIAEQLQALLNDAYNAHGSDEAWKIHIQYETLHPFNDCNGRSGRMLWYWMMWPQDVRGFLHEFYYQTLENVQRI